MKPEQVREMSADELRSKERELQEQLFRLRFQKSIGQLDDAGKIRDTRRDIARVKTVIRQRDIERARTQGAEAKR
ncbi:MAG: 50S ribosomal protein L29 [Acidobacteria bacterium]|nr:MAG: 50S ribosomal protein L29 [Acidobacteriota bacterium]PYQ19916.1 MAG: 50S ribosomal protein L29 [Acidobacteriota bacterium]